MGQRHCTRHLPYTPAQLYDLVKDIEKYPEFLPGCLGGRILSQTESHLVADLVVGYKFFRETFRSRVHLTPKTHIEVEYLEGPFEYLHNSWSFENAPAEGTFVNFFIKFRLRRSFFHHLSQVFLEKTFQGMMEAFEMRAQQIYGLGGGSLVE